jgi:hypothetical protein
MTSMGAMKTVDPRSGLLCSFNGRSALESARMFEGKRAAICDMCLPTVIDVLEDGGGSSPRPGELCSFCENSPTPTTRLIWGPGVCICDACVRRFAAEATGGV